MLKPRHNGRVAGAVCMASAFFISGAAAMAQPTPEASEARAALLIAKAQLAENLVHLNAILAYQGALIESVEAQGSLLVRRPDPGAVCGARQAGICAFFPATFMSLGTEK